MLVRRTRPLTRLVRVSAAAGLALALTAPLTGAAVAAPGDHWVGTWAASPQDSTSTANEQTYRDMVHTSIAGTTERVRLTNVFGTQPVTFGAAYLGLRASGAAVTAGSNRQLTFNGSPQVTIPAGQETYSDPVNLAVDAQKDLAVSLYIQGPSGPATVHSLAVKTSYFSSAGSGNHGSEEAATAFTNTVTSWFFLAGVDVLAPANVSTVATFGDSITDGYAATTDADNRYPDDLARRLLQRSGGQDRSTANAGISGNEVTQDRAGSGVAAVKRLDRDVLAESGVSHVILLEGINDIGAGGVGAEAIIAGYRDIIARVHARGLKILGGTLTPSFGCPFPGYGTPDADARRQTVNNFIRNSGEFDGVIDFDAAIRDPLDPQVLDPQYNSGDSLHPNPAGYAAMANAINLALLESQSPPADVPEAPYAALLPIAAVVTVAGAATLRRRTKAVTTPA